jgi:hypothetical protein
LNNVAALARTAKVFDLHVVASTSATKVYSGPLMPSVQAAIPEVVALDRHNMNAWEDDAMRGAIKATKRQRLTYDGARAIVEAHGGGYGIGLAYARDMIHPAGEPRKRASRRDRDIELDDPQAWWRAA